MAKFHDLHALMVWRSGLKLAHFVLSASLHPELVRLLANDEQFSLVLVSAVAGSVGEILGLQFSTLDLCN